ncbi:hypothetical protein K3495_g2824 [Podosphaera aphanis]|nr:hypothetical protein K3495_g2824 [Podosphaera aphanis]
MQQLTLTFSALSLLSQDTSTQISPLQPISPPYATEQIPLKTPIPTHPKSSDVTEFKGVDASRWLRAYQAVWPFNGWQQDSIPHDEYINFMDVRLAPDSPASQFFDESREIQAILAKDGKYSDDVARLELSPSKKLEAIRQGDKTFRAYYLDCVEVINSLASDIPRSGIPVDNNQIWARVALAQYGIYTKPLPEVFEVVQQMTDHLERTDRAEHNQMLRRNSSPSRPDSISPPAPPTPRSFDFGFPSSQPPRQLVRNAPGSVHGPMTALVPYGQPIVSANTDDSLFEGCSRETHYPIPQRRHSTHPFVREPASWSGQICCIRCGKADHYIPQYTTHTTQHLACWEKGYLQALIASETKRDGSGNKGPTGFMHAAKRVYDDANLPLPGGTNPTARPSLRHGPAPIQQAQRASGVNSVPLGNRPSQMTEGAGNAHQVQFHFGGNAVVDRSQDDQLTSAVQIKNLQNYPLSPQAEPNVNEHIDSNAGITRDNFPNPRPLPVLTSSEESSQFYSPFIHPSRRTLVCSDAPPEYSPATADVLAPTHTTKFSTKLLTTNELFARMIDTKTSELCLSGTEDDFQTKSCNDRDQATGIYTIWLEQDEYNSPLDRSASALAVEAKRTRDSTDTEEARRTGRTNSTIKPAKKRRSSQGPHDSDPNVAVRFDTSLPEEIHQKPTDHRYDQGDIEVRHPKPSGQERDNERRPTRAAPPAVTIISDDCDVVILSKPPPFTLGRNATSSNPVTADPSLTHPSKSIPQNLISQSPTSRSPIANTFTTQRPVTQPLRNFSRQNYHKTTQTPFQTLLRNCPVFQQAKKPTSAFPSHDFGYNISQSSRRNQKVPKDKDRNTIDTAELLRQRAATLRVVGDPRALTKLAAINGKKGMIPLAARELLESTMVSFSLLDLAQFSPAFAQDTKSLISRKNCDRKPSRPKSSRKPIKIESDTLLASFDILIKDLKSSQAYVLQVNGPGLHGFDVRKVGAGKIDCINPNLVAARREAKHSDFLATFPMARGMRTLAPYAMWTCGKF